MRSNRTCQLYFGVGGFLILSIRSVYEMHLFKGKKTSFCVWKNVYSTCVRGESMDLNLPGIYTEECYLNNK